MVLGGFIGLMTGAASAFFLYSLDYVTSLRMENPWSLFFLPLGGPGSASYITSLARATKGNNLILEQIHGGTESIPLRMAPLVLIGTLITHLFGDLQDVRALPFRWEEVYRSGSVSLSALRRRIENTANLRN